MKHRHVRVKASLRPRALACAWHKRAHAPAPQMDFSEPFACIRLSLYPFHLSVKGAFSAWKRVWRARKSVHERRARATCTCAISTPSPPAALSLSPGNNSDGVMPQTGANRENRTDCMRSRSGLGRGRRVSLEVVLKIPDVLVFVKKKLAFNTHVW